MAKEPRFNCGIDAAMSVIEGRWKCTILCLLARNGEMRFSEILKTIGVISTRMLSRQLKELEGDGMINRIIHDDSSVKVSYSLTAKGESILPVLIGLAQWGSENMFNNLVKIDIPNDSSLLNGH